MTATGSRARANAIFRRPAETHRLSADELAPHDVIVQDAPADAVVASNPCADTGRGEQRASPTAAMHANRAHVGAFEAAAARAQAKDALMRMGYKPHVARDAIETAIAELGDLPLEQLVFQALRRCPSR